MQSIFAVVCVFNRLELTQRFLESFRQVQYPNKQLIICDDGSTDGTAEFLKQQPDVIVVQGDGNLWWSGGTNAAIRAALERGADYVLTVNNDATLAPDCLDHLSRTASQNTRSIIAASIQQLQAPDLVWCLGSTYLNHDGALYICDCTGSSRDLIQTIAAPCLSIDTMPGNGVLYPAWIFAEIGLFDEQWTPHYHGDTLLVYRAAKAGIARRLDLQAFVTNDMSPPSPNQRDPLTHVGVPNFLPAVYRTVLEREAETVALDTIGHLTRLHHSQAFLKIQAAWRQLPPPLPMASFTTSPHVGQCLPNGAFALLGYTSPASLSISTTVVEGRYTHKFTGAGLLSLVIQNHRPGTIRLFFRVDQARHRGFDVLASCHAKGILPFQDQKLLWFDIDLQKPGLFTIPISIWSPSPWQELLVLSSENLHPSLV